MKERMQHFMTGRYGMDNLSRFLNVVALVILVLGLFVTSALATVGLALMIYNYFRAFSRNSSARAAENEAFLKVRYKITRWFSNKKKHFAQRKEYRFYTCSSCKRTVRVPVGKGKIEITCPVCHHTFIRRS